MKSSGPLLAAAVLILGVVATLAVTWSGGDPAVEPQRQTGEGAPAPAPVSVPDTDPGPTYQAPSVPEVRTRWSDVNDAGIAALERGEHEAAIRAFEGCLEAEPHEDVYARNLAEALARAAVRQHDDAGSQEERLAAIQLLERATRLDPSRERLVQLLGRWKRSAATEEGFYVHRTEHFEVSFDLDRGEVRGEIEQVGLLLEDAYQTFSEAFGIRPADGDRSEIRVVVYTREGFDRVTGIGPWAGGVYDGTIRVPVGDLRAELARVRGVLRHELLHAFVQEKGGARVPAWLNEGLAQWLEQDRPSIRLGDVARARTRLAGHTMFDLEQLAGSLATWEDPAQIELAYAQSLALIGWIADRYMSNDVQSVGVLFEMVAGCAEGVPAEVTFQQRIGLTLETVLGDMAEGL